MIEKSLTYQSARRLGVQIDERLNWRKHVDLLKVMYQQELALLKKLKNLLIGTLWS